MNILSTRFDVKKGKLIDNNQVWVMNTVGGTLKSAELSVDESVAEENGSQVSAYPNPFISVFNLSVTNPDEIEKIEIFDM
jgi:hypothetical protein